MSKHLHVDFFSFFLSSFLFYSIVKLFCCYFTHIKLKFCVRLFRFGSISFRTWNKNKNSQTITHSRSFSQTNRVFTWITLTLYCAFVSLNRMQSKILSKLQSNPTLHLNLCVEQQNYKFNFKANSILIITCNCKCLVQTVHASEQKPEMC